MCRFFVIAAALAFCVLPIGFASPGNAQTPTVHPVWAAGEVPHDAEGRRAFGDAVARYQMGSVETMDVPRPAPPRAPELLRTGKTAVEKLNFVDAEPTLDQAVAEVLDTGGAGMSAAVLGDLFLYQAMAAQKATWKAPPATPTSVLPAKVREAYLRAAVLAPDRTLDPKRFPPIALESWKVVMADVRQRARGSILVRASNTAEITIDGRAPQLSPATAPSLPYGEHFIRVEDAGQTPWSAVVSLAETTMTVDAPPTQLLVLDDGEAASHARRQGAAYALVGQVVPGAAPQVEVRLIDAATGARRDATTVPLRDRAAVEAAVMHLDEVVRRREFAARAGEGSRVALGAPVVEAAPVDRAGEDAGGWMRRRWPLVTAVGVAVGSALVLGLVVANDSDTRAPVGRR